MGELIFLNKKEKSKIFDSLSACYGFEKFEMFDDYEIMSKKIMAKEKSDDSELIFLMSRSILDISLENLRIDSMGLFFGELRKGKIKLGIDGSHLIGKGCTKNILSLERAQLNKYILGEDIVLHAVPDSSDQVIIESGGDFFGSAKVRIEHGGGIVINGLPKERRVSSIIKLAEDEEENIIE